MVVLVVVALLIVVGMWRMSCRISCGCIEGVFALICVLHSDLNVVTAPRGKQRWIWTQRRPCRCGDYTLQALNAHSNSRQSVAERKLSRHKDLSRSIHGHI